MSSVIGAVPVLPRLVEVASPQVVLAMDHIRRDLDDIPDFDEFCLFAREYPRCYRFHFDGATFRLRSMHTCLSAIHKELVTNATSRESSFEVGLFNPHVNQLYWDFESYLSEINVALNLLARVVGPAFKQQSPPSFNNLCKQNQEHVVLGHFRQAKLRWVDRLKDYRDCFMHYTPVDYRPVVTLRRYSTGWKLHTRLPVNPNVREMFLFKFSRRVDLMRYAITTYKHLTSLDRAIARTILRLYRTGEFPVRKTHLFFVGQRTR